MLFKPSPLSLATLDVDTLEKDKTACRKFGPCGLGEKAIYLNSFYFDRRYYLPYTNVSRIYKRIAMSKGGFSGHGIFASLPYLVAEYDNGQEKQCLFKHEEQIDELLTRLSKIQPQIKRVSKKAEERLARRAAELASRPKPKLTADAQTVASELERAETYLEQKPELANAMSQAAKAKRVNDRTNPAYKWVALAFLVIAILIALWGLWIFLHGQTNGVFALLLGLAVVLFFSSSQVLPTARNNKKAVAARLDASRVEVQAMVEDYGSAFPVPARYAHPIVLSRMKRIVEEGRAQNAIEALEILKSDLKALNADVQVEQEEYDEVVAIKPLFLIADYR